MSKKNGRGPDLQSVDAYQEEKLSSGVVVTILPFPARLHDNIQSRGLEKFPDPVPPKKIVKVAGGTEETDNFNDPVYLEESKRTKTLRDQWIGQQIGENVLDLCLQVDPEPYNHAISKLAKTLEQEVPGDHDEKRVFFLVNYALRGRADYERVTSVSLTLMAVGDKEIEARMDNFRREMARAVNSNSEASRSNEEIRVDVE